VTETWFSSVAIASATGSSNAAATVSVNWRLASANPA
jgi:hypothetical protein